MEKLKKPIDPKLLCAALQAQDSIKQVKQLIILQEDSIPEVGGHLYLKDTNNLYLNVLPSFCQDTLRNVEKISKGDFSVIPAIRKYILNDNSWSKYNKGKIALNDSLIRLLGNIENKQKYNPRLLTGITKLVSNSCYLHDVQKEDGYISDFHIHCNGRGPSPGDLGQPNDDLVISYLLGKRRYCTFYYVHGEKFEQIITLNECLP